MKGFIVIIKPTGITSAKVVAKVKQLLPKKTKIGHTGTLDPNVTGVLPLVIGKATKSIPFMNEEVKCYACKMQFGIKTNTADIWGEKISVEQVASFDKEHIETVLSRFIGEVHQYPPMFSALKHNGKRLYTLAREGIEVERKTRKIFIHYIDNIVYEHPHLSFTVSCSRGTYIRTLCEDIASQLDTIGCMTALDRLATGPFNYKQGIALEQMDQQILIENLLPVDFLFKAYKTITVDKEHALHLLNGVKVNLERFIDNKINKDNQYVVYYDDIFIGVAHFNGVHIRLQKLFADTQDLNSRLE